MWTTYSIYISKVIYLANCLSGTLMLCMIVRPIDVLICYIEKKSLVVCHLLAFFILVNNVLLWELQNVHKQKQI